MALLVASPAAAAPPQPFRFQDPQITESSAIVAVGGTYFTINDSGDSARVFAVDRRGRTVGVTTYGADVLDVEALAEGPDGTLLAGDIGDNDGERDHVTLYQVPLFKRGDHDVTPTAYDLVYADGPRDAETLLVHPETGRVYVVSKGLLGGTVYRAPKRLRADRTNVLQPIASAPGLITDGTFLPDGDRVLLRDYSSAMVVEPLGDWPVDDFFRLPAQEQGEGIDVQGDYAVLSTEGEHAKVSFRRIPTPPEAPAVPKVPVGEPAAPAEPDADGPWGRNWVPVSLGAAWLVVLVLGVRAFRRRSRYTS